MPFYDASEVERNEIAPGRNNTHHVGRQGDDEPRRDRAERRGAQPQPPARAGGVMIQGEFEMTIGDETRLLRAGDAYVIPGGVEHSVKCGDGWALALDIFSPPREDYMGGDEKPNLTVRD